MVHKSASKFIVFIIALNVAPTLTAPIPRDFNLEARELFARGIPLASWVYPEDLSPPPSPPPSLPPPSELHPGNPAHPGYPSWAYPLGFHFAHHEIPPAPVWRTPPHGLPVHISPQANLHNSPVSPQAPGPAFPSQNSPPVLAFPAPNGQRNPAWLQAFGHASPTPNSLTHASGRSPAHNGDRHSPPSPRAPNSR